RTRCNDISAALRRRECGCAMRPLGRRVAPELRPDQTDRPPTIARAAAEAARPDDRAAPLPPSSPTLQNRDRAVAAHRRDARPAGDTRAGLRNHRLTPGGTAP